MPSSALPEEGVTAALPGLSDQVMEWIPKAAGVGCMVLRQGKMIRSMGASANNMRKREPPAV